jgi:hypothetical protein
MLALAYPALTNEAAFYADTANTNHHEISRQIRSYLSSLR